MNYCLLLLKIIPSLKTSYVVLAIFLAKSSPIFSSWNQRAKKVVSDSPELVDFAIGQVKSFEEFKSQKNCEINSAHQNIFRLVEMTFGLVYASFSLPEWQALKMTFLHHGTVLPTWINVPPSCIHYQNNSTSSPGLLSELFNNLAICYTTDIISSHIAKFLQIWSTIAGYYELCVGFSQPEMEKYFEWIIIMIISFSKS